MCMHIYLDQRNHIIFTYLMSCSGIDSHQLKCILFQYKCVSNDNLYVDEEGKREKSILCVIL
jgi:hypothetical protein